MGRIAFGCQELRSQRRFLRSHGVEAANGKHRKFWMIEILDQLHVAEDGGVSCVIEHGAIGNG